MAEQFEELTSKILKEEMQEGICVKIADDIYVGGETKKKTALNYQLILEVDAAKGGASYPQAGIGHVLYAVKTGEKRIVRLSVVDQ